MRLNPSVLFCLLPFLATTNAYAYAYKKCLTDKSAAEYVEKWQNLFRASPEEAKLAKKILDYNFKGYDETFVNPLMKPLQEVHFANRAALVADQSPKPSFLSIPSFSTVYIFHDCENIAWRWEYTATILAAVPGFNTTLAPVGATVQYKGIDLLQIDCEAQKIKASYTSQDILNWYVEIGAEFCVDE